MVNLSVDTLIEMGIAAVGSRDPHKIYVWLQDQNYKNAPSIWQIGKKVNQ